MPEQIIPVGRPDSTRRADDAQLEGPYDPKAVARAGFDVLDQSAPDSVSHFSRL